MDIMGIIPYICLARHLFFKLSYATSKNTNQFTRNQLAFLTYKIGDNKFANVSRIRFVLDFEVISAFVYR